MRAGADHAGPNVATILVRRMGELGKRASMRGVGGIVTAARAAGHPGSGVSAPRPACSSGDGSMCPSGSSGSSGELPAPTIPFLPHRATPGADLPLNVPWASYPHAGRALSGRVRSGYRGGRHDHNNPQNGDGVDISFPLPNTGSGAARSGRTLTIHVDVEGAKNAHMQAWKPWKVRS